MEKGIGMQDIITKLKLGFTVFMTPFNLGLFLGSLDNKTYKFLMVKKGNEVGIQLVEDFKGNELNIELN